MQAWQQLMSKNPTVPNGPTNNMFKLMNAVESPQSENIETTVSTTKKNQLKARVQVEEDQKWEVEKILGDKIDTKDHIHKWQVLWELGDITWEPLENLLDENEQEIEILKEYRKNKQSKTKRKQSATNVKVRTRSKKAKK